MDLHQLRTFVTVAREGSITRAAALLHLSQPAVSAHVKAMEDALGLSLFERTARGMSLTREGQRLLAKAEQTIAAHQELMAEASRAKGEVSGKLRIGAGSSASNEAVGRLLTQLAARWPGVEVALVYRTSREVLAGLRSGDLDAGFYSEAGEADPELSAIEVGRFAIHLASAPGLVAQPLAWGELAELPWIYPPESACCGRAAEKLFASRGFRPGRIIAADRQEVTRALIAGGVGVGLLHADAAAEARRAGDVELLFEAEHDVRVLFVHLASRAADPVVAAAAAILRT